MTDPRQPNESKGLELDELKSLMVQHGMVVVCPSVASDKLPHVRLTSNEPTIKLNNRTKTPRVAASLGSMLPTPNAHSSAESVRFGPQQLYDFQASYNSLNQAQVWLNTIDTSKLQRNQG